MLGGGRAGAGPGGIALRCTAQSVLRLHEVGARGRAEAGASGILVGIEIGTVQKVMQETSLLTHARNSSHWDLGPSLKQVQKRAK